jgi:hypothetical protein
MPEPEQSEQPEQPEQPEPQRVGGRAVERGLITTEQLQAAEAEHERRRAAGSQLPFGELLVEMELITPGQLRGLLSAHGVTELDEQPIPGYVLIRKLGEGGMGATYLARQETLNRLVALKVLKRRLASNREFLARFRREAQLAGRLSHVNIVQHIDLGEAGGFHYIAMEYVEGQTVNQRMKAGPIDEKTALDIAIQVARALEFASRSGIIHRDVKPDNIMVCANGVAKLCDFGLARQAESDMRLTQTGMAVGTPHYVSPEQARGEQDVDIRSDVYSLGATLYHMVTGVPPFEGDSAMVIMTRHLTDQLTWPADVNPAVSQNCSRLIARMLQKDRAARYQTPAELLADLELVVDGQAPLKGAPRPKPGAAATAILGAAKGPGRRPATGKQDTAGTAGRLLEPVARRRKPRSSRPLLAGACAAAVVLGAGFYAVSRIGWRQEQTASSAQAEAAAMAAWPGVAALAGENLSPQQAVVLKIALDDFRRQHGRTAFAISREQERRRLAALAEQAFGQGGAEALKAAQRAELLAKAEEEFRRLKDEGGKLAADGDYDGALAALDRMPPKSAALLADRIGAEQKALRKAAEERLGPAIEAAERLSKAGEPEKAQGELDKVRAVKYAALAARIEDLGKRLEAEKSNVAEIERKRRRAEAEKRLAGLLDDFDAQMLAGRVRAAAERLTAERGKLGDLAGAVAAELDAAEAVAREAVAQEAARSEALKTLVGKKVALKAASGDVHQVTVTAVRTEWLEVERSYSVGGDLKSIAYRMAFRDLAPGEVERLTGAAGPRNADGQLAAAISAIGRREWAAAEQALAAAGKHLLGPRYVAKLAEGRKAELEAAARAAWEALAQGVRPKPSAEEARNLLAALDDYAAKHGATDFAAGKKAEREALAAAATAVIEAVPESLTVRVRRLFKGKVVNFDPRTGQIELFWDFEDPGQIDDFTFACGSKWRVEGGALVGEFGGDWVRAAVQPELRLAGDCRLSCTMTVQSPGMSGLAVVAGPKESAIVCGDCTFVSQPRISTLIEDATRNGPVASKPVPALAAGAPWQVELAVSGGRISGQVDGQSLPAQNLGLKSYRPALHQWPPGGNRGGVSYDNFRVVGFLDRAWLETEKARFTARTGPQPVFQAEWRELKFSGAKPGARAVSGSALAYDSKRKRIMFFGSQYENDLWALDLAAGSWTRLQDSNPKDPEVDKTRPPPVHIDNQYLEYDEAADKIWFGWSWAYDPGTGSWTKRTEELKGTTLYYIEKGFGPRPSWAYDPFAKNFLFLTGGSALLIWPGERRAERLPGRPAPVTWYDGGLAFDRKNRLFVQFGGVAYQKGLDGSTWTFDPQTKDWRRCRPEASPPARALHKLVWHDRLGAMVLIGGKSDKDVWLDALWVYETVADRWTEIKVPKAPPAGYWASCYEASQGLVVLVNDRGQTWTLSIDRAGGR